jgi:hypothetical protein
MKITVDTVIKHRLTPETYTICRKAFIGGDTHASYRFFGDIVKNVRSYDISSHGRLIGAVFRSGVLNNETNNG